jgi:hypothetical protein
MRALLCALTVVYFPKGIEREPDFYKILSGVGSNVGGGVVVPVGTDVNDPRQMKAWLASLAKEPLQVSGRDIYLDPSSIKSVPNDYGLPTFEAIPVGQGLKGKWVYRVTPQYDPTTKQLKFRVSGVDEASLLDLPKSKLQFQSPDPIQNPVYTPQADKR